MNPNQLPHMHKWMLIELIKSRISSVDRQNKLHVVPFTIIAQSKAVILGRQPLYAVLAPSTA